MVILRALPAAALFILAGCGTAGNGERTGSLASLPQPVARLGPAGEEGIMGAAAPALIRIFGPPRLDEAEGPARKLQFSGACVLDIYLYPTAAGGTLRASFIAARLTDGRAANRAACIAALRRR